MDQWYRQSFSRSEGQKATWEWRKTRLPRIQNLVQNPAKRELQMHMGLLGKVIGEWCPSLIGKAFRLLVGPTTVNTYPVRKSGNSLQVIAKVVFCYAVEKGSEVIPRVSRLRLNVGKLMYVLSSGQLLSSMFEIQIIFQNCVNRASVKKNKSFLQTRNSKTSFQHSVRLFFSRVKQLLS